MHAADVAVDRLVLRVREMVADRRDPAALRTALAAVLADLGVLPGDPAWTDGRDVVGAAYERLLPGRDRRTLGQFFTPLPIGRAMAAWLLGGRPRLLLDPACGSLSLLSAVAHEPLRGTSLAGIDIDPLALEMAQVNADLRELDNVSLRLGNFLGDELEAAPDA